MTVLVLSLALLVAACGGDDDDDGEKAADGKVAGGQFSLALREPEVLLPANATSLYSAQVLFSLFTGLVEYDAATAAPKNALAQSITSSDQKLWTIKIKPGWTFHNGEAVTAQSFVDAWNFAAYAPNANENSFFFDKIEGYDALQGDPDANPPVAPTAKELTGLKAVDETTFTVGLTEPFSQFPLTLGFQAYYPMPKAGLSDPKAFGQAPIGNGPFQFVSWHHDESIRVKRYAGYKGAAPSADAVEFRIFSDDDTAYRELQADGIDIATSVPLPEIAAAREEFGTRFVERPSSAFNYLGFPLNQPAFGKPELRQAISLAIDRKAIVDAIYEGTRTPAASVIAPLVAGSRKDACATCSLDVAKAKALLAKAGGWSGTLHLWFSSGQGNEEPMEAIANNLRANLGITDIKFESLPFAEYKAKVKAHEVNGPFLFNWLMDYPSPQSYLEPLYSSTSASNRTGYVNKEVDALIAAGNRAGTLAASVKEYQAAEDLILADMPLAPLWFGKTRAVHSGRVRHVVIDPFSRIRVQDVAVTG